MQIKSLLSLPIVFKILGISKMEVLNESAVLCEYMGNQAVKSQLCISTLKSRIGLYHEYL